MAHPHISAAEVREIYERSGFTHAEMCVEQAESQLGDDALADARAELRKIEREEAAASGFPV